MSDGASGAGGATGKGGESAAMVETGGRPASPASGSGGSSKEAGPAPSTPTYTAVVAIQDESIANAPEAGHGLSAEMLFTGFRAPDYEETPGSPTGCKAWVYDARANPAPPLSDQGVVTVTGLAGGTLDCKFDPEGRYRCPTAEGVGATSVSPATSGMAEYAISNAAFSTADVGRYLRIQGAKTASNNGQFPIVGVPSRERIAVAKAAGVADEFSGRYTVLAGAGPIPEFQGVIFLPETGVTIGIAKGGAGALDFPDVGPVNPGGTFTVDDATRAALVAIPLHGSALSMSSSGKGGQSNPSPVTVVRITTTDGNTAAVPEFAMPEAIGKQVEIQCAVLGGDGTVTLSETVMKFLKDANEASPTTRIRTAYMRDGFGLGANSASLPPNRVTVLVGHAILGFSNP